MDGSVVLKMIENEWNKIKYACFGKIKLTSKDRKEKEVEKWQQKKIDIIQHNSKAEEEETNIIDTNIAKLLKEIEKERLDKEVRSLQNLGKNKGKSAGVFRLFDKVLGKKKVEQEAVIL